MVMNNKSLEGKPLYRLDDEGKPISLQSWNEDDFKTLFKHYALNRVNKESRICFAAQPDQKYHQCNFVFLLYKEGSNEICDKWNEQSPGQLKLKDYHLFRGEIDATSHRELMEGNSGVLSEASFKIYKNSKDPR